MEVGERIKYRREQLNMTQGELAKKVGYTSRSSVAKVEANANGMVQSKLILFAEALQTTPAYLLGWEDGEPTYKNEDAVSDIFVRLRNDSKFLEATQMLYNLNEEQLDAVITMLQPFNNIK